jgi:hypothetical protein
MGLDELPLRAKEIEVFFGGEENKAKRASLEIKLNSDEIEILKRVISPLMVQKRSGQVGILHGMDRFVSTNVSLKESQKEILEGVFKKLGLSGIKEYKE